MPVRKVKGGYRWGRTGKVYKSRAAAERQGRGHQSQPTTTEEAMNPDENVDTAVIATKLRVSGRTVHSWRRRNLGFPEPTGRIGGRPYWKWEEIESWAKQTGRA